MSLAKIKKGDTVIMVGFTGMKLGRFEVAKATEKSLTIEKTNGDLAIFSRKTGKQTNVEEGKEKYANKLIEDDGTYTNPLEGRMKKAKKSKKSKEAEEVEEKPAKKSKKSKKTPAKLEPVEVVEDDEDFDDDEDFEDFDEE